MNRIFGIVLSFLLIVGLTNSVDAAANLKIGVILVGDETEGYTEAHIKGISEAAKESDHLEEKSRGGFDLL